MTQKIRYTSREVEASAAKLKSFVEWKELQQMKHQKETSLMLASALENVDPSDKLQYARVQRWKKRQREKMISEQRDFSAVVLTVLLRWGTGP